MPRAPKVYEGLKPAPLSPEQEEELKKLEWIIDKTLNKKDNTDKTRITVCIGYIPPRTNVLFRLAADYRNKGWKEVIISPKIDRDFSQNGYWVIRFTKHPHFILGTGAQIWALTRG